MYDLTIREGSKDPVSAHNPCALPSWGSPLTRYVGHQSA